MRTALVADPFSGEPVSRIGWQQRGRDGSGYWTGPCSSICATASWHNYLGSTSARNVSASAFWLGFLDSACTESARVGPLRQDAGPNGAADAQSKRVGRTYPG